MNSGKSIIQIREGKGKKEENVTKEWFSVDVGCILAGIADDRTPVHIKHDFIVRRSDDAHKFHRNGGHRIDEKARSRFEIERDEISL